MNPIIRHGDVLLRKVPGPQTGHADKLVLRKSKIILHGEVTGHAHRMVEDTASILDYYEKTWRSEQPMLTASYLHVSEPATITHEEHGPLSILPGWYEIVRAREFDYTANLSQRVMD